MNISEALEYLRACEDHTEPVFVIRGRDTLSENTVLFWVREAIREGVPTDKVHGAVAVALACRNWPEKRKAD